MAGFGDQLAGTAAAAARAELTQAAHRLGGLAGTIGFPTVSLRAAELERLLMTAVAETVDAGLACGAIVAIREAFHSDLERPPEWAASPAPTLQRSTILVADDEPDHAAIVTACLEGAGYTAIVVAAGDRVLATARAEKPALILLDIAMPRLDGYSVCRLLKADPELAGIPVIFISAGANLDDRLAGLTLGADEFLTKPVDMRELVLRIQIVIARCRAQQAPVPVAARELAYDAFLALAIDEIGRSPAAFAMVRLPSDRHGEVVTLLTEELRGRDAIGSYDLTRVLILMPEMAALAARDRLDLVVDRLAAHGLTGICMGVTGPPGTESKGAEALIGEADEALAEARYLGHKTAIWSDHLGRTLVVPAARTVVVAEDDPDVTRIVDAQVRAAGHKVVVAFDGEQALAAVRAHAPDVLVLDLMMPKLDGFEVLRQLREGPTPGPRVIVLSGRGREQDVMRAFDLGADDYMTKPFNPQELMARITRVLK